MFDLFFKTLDLGSLFVFFVAFPAFGGAAAMTWLPEATTVRVRVLGFAAVFVVCFVLCAALFDRVGDTTRGAWLLEHDGELRIATRHTRVGKGRGSCGLRVFDLDGRYLAGTYTAGGCSDSVYGGIMVQKIPNGLFTGSDWAATDLWTGEDLASLSERTEGPHQVIDVGPTGVQVRYQDGRTSFIPWPTGSNAKSVFLTAEASWPGDTLFDAVQLTGTCKGNVLVRHRSVAFGDGSTLLSAAATRGAQDFEWTVDLTERWGDWPLLGVFEHQGRCLAVGGLRNGNIQVITVP